MVVYIQWIDGRVAYKNLTEARAAAYNELKNPHSIYGQVEIYPNKHANKPSEIIEVRDRMIVSKRDVGNYIHLHFVGRYGKFLKDIPGLKIWKWPE